MNFSNAINEFRTQFQAYSIKELFLKTIQNHQVILLVGKSGSGKTTLIPQFCVEFSKSLSYEKRKKVVCSQSNRFSVVSAATYVSEVNKV